MIPRTGGTPSRRRRSGTSVALAALALAVGLPGCGGAEADEPVVAGQSVLSEVEVASTAVAVAGPSSPLPGAAAPGGSSTVIPATVPSTTTPATTIPATTAPTTVPSTAAPTTAVPTTVVPTTLPSTTLPSTTLPSTVAPAPLDILALHNVEVQLSAGTLDVATQRPIVAGYISQLEAMQPAGGTPPAELLAVLRDLDAALGAGDLASAATLATRAHGIAHTFAHHD